ncbi:hypothetical protein B0H10DRAFT_1938739 [Mycena sp. CBHHK59/15]|nr:hypothetical protein B0H10DRAFT_1938739 [Mycena sp. CBHHK59/15]
MSEDIQSRERGEAGRRGVRGGRRATRRDKKNEAKENKTGGDDASERRDESESGDDGDGEHRRRELGRRHVKWGKEKNLYSVNTTTILKTYGARWAAMGRPNGDDRTSLDLRRDGDANGNAEVADRRWKKTRVVSCSRGSVSDEMGQLFHAEGVASVGGEPDGAAFRLLRLVQTRAAGDTPAGTALANPSVITER